MDSSNITPTFTNCTMCNATGKLKTCDDCHLAAYCSQVCEDGDKCQHSFLCYSLKSLGPRPSMFHFRAIHFPPNDIAPKWVWLQDDEDIAELVGEYVRQLSFNKNPYRHFDLPDKRILNIEHRDTFSFDGSVANMSITFMHNGGPSFDWRGDIVLTCAKFSDGTGYQDVDLADFRYAIDFFRSYYNKYTLNPSQRGVKIRCDSDMAVYQKKRFGSLFVPIDHAIWTIGKKSAIAERLGLPLRIWQKGPDHVWAGMKESESPRSNQPAAFLTLNLDTHSEEFGCADPHWNLYLGTGLVVYADQKAILPHHVSALAHWCQNIISPVFEDYREYHGWSLNATLKEEILDRMTKEKFLEFFEEFRKKQAVKNSTWLSIPDPYEYRSLGTVANINNQSKDLEPEDEDELRRIIGQRFAELKKDDPGAFDEVEDMKRLMGFRPDI